MTGGTEKAYLLNKNLATIAGEFGFGMGLGSCRSLLDSDSRIADFDFKQIIGDYPFFINLGIAQLEQLITSDQIFKIVNLLEKLSADGLVIHVNPMQEWFQPEGDRYMQAPLETIKSICNRIDTKIIVKEVGQGFGPRSLKSLMSLPLAAIELSGFGGTNFSLLELSRHNAQKSGNESSQSKLVKTGHTAEQMICWINESILDPHFENLQCRNFIISGGVKCLLDGYKLQNQLQAKSIIGMASGFLSHAHDLDLLRDFVSTELESYRFARAYLE
jgi:isopentenyl-diphosphate delta-isomerase